jgi:hypothetical protein
MFLLAIATPVATACTGDVSPDDGSSDTVDAAHDVPTSNEASADIADAAVDAGADAQDDISNDTGPGVLTVASTGDLVSSWTCGDPFPAGGEVTLRNDGGASVVYHSAFSGAYATSFAATGATNGTLAPGESATIHVAPVRWSFDGTPLATRSAVFHVYADDGALGGGDVSVEITPHGAILVGDSLEATFGDVRVGSTAAIAYSTSNLGDREGSLIVGAFDDPQFTSSIAAGTYTIAAHDTRTDTVTFAPTSSGSATGQLSFIANGPICYTNVATRTFRGDAITGNIAVSGDIDFGLTPCGGTTMARTITLTNSGTAPASFTASVGGGSASRYHLSATAGTVAPGTPFTIAVTSDALPNIVPALPGDFGDVVVIATDVPGDSAHVVHLTQGARGAILAWDRSQVNLTAAVGQTATASLTLSNSGSDPVTVQLVSSLGETPVVPSEPAVVPAHGSIAANVSFTAPSATQAFRSAVFPMMPIPGLCEVAPPPVVVDARGSTGEVLLDRDAIEFGNVDCGSSESERTLVVTNPTPSSVTVIARFGLASSPFSIAIGSATPSDAVSTTIPSGASISLVVHAPAIARSTSDTSPLTDTLVLTSDAPSDRGHLVPIHLRPAGAIIGIDAPDIVDFGTVPAGTSASRIVAFTNTGSVPVDIRLTVDPGFYWSRDLLTLPPDGTPVYSTLTGFVSTSGNRAANFDVTVVGATALCAPAPSSHRALLAGAAGSVWLSYSSLDLGRNPCRQAPPPPQIVDIANEGTAPYSFVATTEGPFDVTPTSGSLAPGERMPLRVSARAIVDGVPGQRRGGVLTITSDIPGDSPQYVQLYDRVYGARLSYPTTGLDFGGVRVGTLAERLLGMRNTGDARAIVTIASAAGTSTAFVAGNTLAPDSEMAVSFYPTTVGSFTDDWTLGVSPETPLCAPFAPLPTHLAATAAQEMLYAVPSSIDMGGALCNGAAPDPRTLELRNPTPIPVPFATTWFWGTNSRMAVSPSNGTVPPNGSVTLTVTSMPVPADLELAPSTRPVFWRGGLEDRLHVDFGSGSIDVPVHEHAVGAVFEYEHLATDYDLSVSAHEHDMVSVHTRGSCPGGVACLPRWTLDPVGPLSTFGLTGSDVIFDFVDGTTPGTTATLTVRDRRATDPICHGPPVPLATWTATP